MLVEVPEPVWKMSTTKSLSCLPSITSSAAWTMASAMRFSTMPVSALTTAASRLIIPMAAMNRRGKRRPETGKFWRARSVWAP